MFPSPQVGGTCRVLPVSAWVDVLGRSPLFTESEALGPCTPRPCVTNYMARLSVFFSALYTSPIVPSFALNIGQSAGFGGDVAP